MSCIYVISAERPEEYDNKNINKMGEYKTYLLVKDCKISTLQEENFHWNLFRYFVDSKFDKLKFCLNIIFLGIFLYNLNSKVNIC